MGEADYENPWHYKGTTFTSDDIGDFFGYVYRITNIESGRQYIESISTRNENLKEASDVLRQSLTGSGITEALTNLNKTLNNLVKINSEERS